MPEYPIGGPANTVTVYDFRHQLEIGERGEAQLDALFNQWFEIIPATMDEQRSGVDRWFVRRAASAEGVAGERFAVEYKTDLRACSSGKAFVEMFTAHDDNQVKAGWVYSSISRWLVYYLPAHEVAHVVSFADLRRALRDWQQQQQHRMAHVRNKSWSTWGLLVDLHEVEQIARRSLVVRLPAQE
jgi:hypothetical protein